MSKFQSLICLLSTLFCSCAYRFSNIHVSPPAGAKTIAIAPIFNTSRSVIAHDHLWHELQYAFASSGHLRLSHPKHADLYLQAHVRDGKTFQYEADSFSTIKDAHEYQVGGAGGTHKKPHDLVNLHASDIFSRRTKLSFNVLIEVWDLRTRKLLLQREYPLSDSYNMFTIPSTQESRFIRNEETQEFLAKNLSKTLAENVVTDLYSTPDFRK